MNRVAAKSPLVLQNFERLGRKDRNAILTQLSEGERLALIETLDAEKRAHAEEETRIRESDRQYLGYSAWLASLIEASVKRDDVSLTTATREALITEHQASVAARQEHELSLGQLILSRLRALVLPFASGAR